MQIYGVKYKYLFSIYFVCMLALSTQAQMPDWAQGAVWYQIFPDRFRNGDTTNDPTLADIKGCWPHNDTAAWEVMPWTSDWYALQPFEQANGQDFNYNAQRRRYGGDLQGIIDKLPYLDSLGVTALYLNPVFVAPSLHKYDAAMYHHIEPTFGPDPEGDKLLIAQEDPSDPDTWQWTSADKLALQLIAACHARGMHIIFDGVFNHMGRNSFAFQDVLRNQERSTYKDWFVIENWADSARGIPFSYTGWFGAPDLPELREDSLGIVSGPKAYIFACTQRWMAPDGQVQNGIDGWRLDVAFCVDMDFWRDWSAHVKSINANAYLTAEINNDVTQVLPYVQGDAFDAVMHYSFASLCIDYFVQHRMTVTTFMQRMDSLNRVYSDEVLSGMMQLYDSHDTPRFTSAIHNPQWPAFDTWGEYLHASHAWHPGTKTNKPSEADYAMQKQMAIFQFTWPGSPMIYYGDEVGMWGANDPDCRKPMVWTDMQYTPEQYQLDGTQLLQADSVYVREDLKQLYAQLAALRAKEQILRTGACRVFPAKERSGMIMFERYAMGQEIGVYINMGKRDRKVRVKYFDDNKHLLVDLLSGTSYAQRNNIVVITIPAGGALVLKEYTAMR